jgi:hypothetical protein
MAAVKEEQRRLFPSISHGGTSVRRFSSKSPNLVNNNKACLVSDLGELAKSDLVFLFSIRKISTSFYG